MVCYNFITELFPKKYVDVANTLLVNYRNGGIRWLVFAILAGLITANTELADPIQLTPSSIYAIFRVLLSWIIFQRVS